MQKIKEIRIYVCKSILHECIDATNKKGAETRKEKFCLIIYLISCIFLSNSSAFPVILKTFLSNCLRRE